MTQLAQVEYKLSREEKTWEEHDALAREWGGHLASVTSAEENCKVRAVAESESCWLGGVRQGEGNGPGAEHWKWSDGSEWAFTEWHPGQPDNWGGNEDCVVALGASFWYDAACQLALPSHRDA